MTMQSIPSCSTVQRMMVCSQRHAIELSHGENIVTEAKTCHLFNEEFLKRHIFPNECVGIFGDWHAPSPFLAVSALDNNVLVLHRI